MSLAIVVLAVAGNAETSFEKKLRSVARGSPQLRDHGISSAGLVACTARKIKGAKLVWVNIPLLKELGFEIPDSGLTSDMRQAILDELAFVIPNSQMPPEKLGQESKVFYADIYGGPHQGNSSGSGRAAAVGSVQSKGIGVTPLSHPAKDGYEYLEGTLKDAFWGEALNFEMPYGANRTLFVISTEIQVPTQNGTRFRALNIRLNPLRPAHYIKPFDGMPNLSVLTHHGIANNLEQLADVLPDGPFTNPAETNISKIIRAGILNLSERLGKQYGVAYAKRIYHGATGASNQLLNGGMIDFGTSSYQPGYARIQTLPNVLPFGHEYLAAEVEGDILSYLIDGLRHKLDSRYGKWFGFLSRGALFRDARAVLRKSYDETLQLELLTLTGAPRDFVKDIDVKTAKALADVLRGITFDAGPAYSADNPLPEKAMVNPLRDLFRQVYQLGAMNKESLSALKISGIGASQTRRFVDAFMPFYEAVADIYSKQGVNSQRLNVYLSYASRAKNQPMSDYYLAALMGRFKNLTEDFEKMGDAAEINSFLSNSLGKIKAKEQANNPFVAPLFRRFDPESGVFAEGHYHVKTGVYALSVGLDPYAPHQEGLKISIEQNGGFQRTVGFRNNAKIRQVLRTGSLDALLSAAVHIRQSNGRITEMRLDARGSGGKDICSRILGQEL